MALDKRVLDYVIFEMEWENPELLTMDKGTYYKDKEEKQKLFELYNRLKNMQKKEADDFFDNHISNKFIVKNL